MEHMAPAHYHRYPDISLAETSRGHPAPVPGPCLISCWGGGRGGGGEDNRTAFARSCVAAAPPASHSFYRVSKTRNNLQFFLPSTQEYFFFSSPGCEL